MASKEVVDRLREGEAVSTAMALLGRRLQVIGEAMSAADRVSEQGEASGPARAEAVARKRAAIAEYDAALDETAALVSVLLRAIGEDALAMEVQPRPRRPERVTKADRGDE